MTITVANLLSEAVGLLGPEEDEPSVNPEYTRAIVELVTRLLPLYNHDDHDEVLAMIRKAGEPTVPKATMSVPEFLDIVGPSLGWDDKDES